MFDRVSSIGVVGGLTVIWWGSTIWVTLLLKTTLGHDAGDGRHKDESKSHSLPTSLHAGHEHFSYPYPFALTLMSNIGTAIICGWLHMLWVICSRRSVCTTCRAQTGAGHELVAPACPAATGRRQRRWPTSALPQMAMREEDWAVQRAFRWLAAREHFMLLVVGLLQGISVAAKNEALLFLSVSKRTMLFSLNVVIVMFLARLFGLEQLGKEKLAAASLLIVGGVLQEMATWKRVQDDAVGGNEPLGCSLAMAALVIDALKWVLLQAALAKQGSPSTHGAPGEPALADAGEPAPAGDTDHGASTPPTVAERGMSKLRAVSWVMLAGVPVCAGMVAAFEPGAAGAAWRAGSAVAGRAVSLSVGVMAINVAEFTLVERTSAVTFNVLANLHSIPIVMAGVLLFADEVVALEMVGFLACVVSALVYSWAKEKEKRQKLLDDEAAVVWMIPDSGSASPDPDLCL